MATRNFSRVGALILGLSVVLAGPARFLSRISAAETSQPIAMHPKAVTLELVCRDGAENGKFKPIHARVLQADTWAAAFRSVADVNGYAAVPRAAGQRPRANRPRQQAAAQAAAAAVTVMVTVAPEDDAATLQIETDGGTASIRLGEVGFQQPQKYLNGLITAKKLYAATRVVASPTENDYPSAARGPDGTIWVAYVAYQRGGEPDMAAAARAISAPSFPRATAIRFSLVHFDGKSGPRRLPVTEPLLDFGSPPWRSTGRAACGSPGASKWAAIGTSIAAATIRPRTNGRPIERVTTDPGSDINVVSTTDSKGHVWWAWQGRRGKHFQIFLTECGVPALGRSP